MNLFPFFRQPTPRRFDHKPIYYDKQKEEREERIKRVKKELGMTDENNEKKDYEQRLRGSFKEAVPGGSSREKMAKTNRTVMIIFIVLLIVVLIAYFLM